LKSKSEGVCYGRGFCYELWCTAIIDTTPLPLAKNPPSVLDFDLRGRGVPKGGKSYNPLSDVQQKSPLDLSNKKVFSKPISFQRERCSTVSLSPKNSIP